MPAGIPPDLYHRLNEVLLRCNPFDSDDALQSVFTDKRLVHWRTQLQPSDSKAERVRRSIDYLYNRQNNADANALVLLLRVLNESIHEDDYRHYEIKELVKHLTQELGSEGGIENVIDTTAQQQSPTLDLSGSGLTELPTALFQMIHLEHLDLSRNALTALPSEISNLRNLRYLDLSQNRLTSLPFEMCKLPLETLDVRGNPLPIPEELLMLPSYELPELSELTVNRLQEVLRRLEIFRSDRDLSVIFVDVRIIPWRNRIPQAKDIPSRVTSAINFLSRQSNVDGENALLLFLQVLADTQDPSDALHTELLRLVDRVRRELLRKSRSPLVPPSVILNYLFPSNQHSLNEAKLLLVGEGGVGKTSLVKRLMDQDYDPNESMTEGILVEHWYTSLDGEPLRLNIWDFGGQEIMYATHQFFLTRRSLYLVVIDARTGERGLDYWLQIVRSYGGNSPIIVVVNKDDIRRIELNEVALQAKYPNIYAFIPTACADETHPGIAQLHQAILNQVAKMPHIRTVWPGAWFEIKNRLEQMERDYITYDDYAAMCAEAGIADTDNHTLIAFLHDLGAVLNYHDDARLQETNVLKPEWVTRAVYAVINARQIIENTGILKMAQLRDILKDRKCYPLHKHGFILNLMSKFELSFALDERHTRYLIPDLLSKNEILLEGWPPQEKNLLFQYRYSVLPGSIITRLIVQMNAHIYHGVVWRTGVCLRYQDNFAVIKADEAAECLSIAVIGNPHTRREFLAILRERLRAIHASFKDLTIAEYVAIPGYPDVYANYNDLLTHEQLGERTYIPSGLAQRIPIAAILDSVIAPEDRGAISGISEALLTRLQQTLALTGFCDDVIALRNQLRDSPVALWINDLREATDPQTQAYEIIRHFHNRTTTAGANGLDLFLDWLIPKISLESQRDALTTLSRQVVAERTAYHTAPSTSSTSNVIYNIIVKEGGQVAAIGNHSNIQGGAHFGDC